MARSPTVALALLLALLLQLLQTADPVRAAVDTYPSYTHPVPPPSLVSAYLFQRGSRFTAGKGPVSLLYASSSTQIQAFDPASGDQRWWHSLHRNVTRPLLNETTGEPLFNATTGEPLVVMEEEVAMPPPSAGSTDTPAAGQFVVDALGAVWVVSASARSLQRFMPVRGEAGSTGPSFVEGGSVDLVAAGLGPAESLVVQSIDVIDASRVVVYALPAVASTAADGATPRVPVLSLFDSSSSALWNLTGLGSAHAECVSHPRHIAMLIPNDGKPPGTAASVGAAPIYVQCGGLISAIDVDTQEVLWQRAYPVRELAPATDAEAGAPRFAFPLIQAASPETGDLFVYFEASSEDGTGAEPVPSIERLGARTGAASPATFSPARVTPPPEGARDEVQMLAIVADIKSCLTSSIACRDKLLVHVYNSAPQTQTQTEGASPASAAAFPYAFLSAYAPPVMATQPAELLWDTTASFLPPGGSHSAPYARSAPEGDDELYWLVRSERLDPDTNRTTGAFDLPILYVVRAADGVLLRSFDTQNLQLPELNPRTPSSDPAAAGQAQAAPPSCTVLEVQPDLTVFLSCPFVFGHVVALKSDDPAWLVAEGVPGPDPSASTGADSSTAAGESGSSASAGSTAEGPDSSTGWSSSSSTSSGTDDSSGAGSSSGGTGDSSTGSSTGSADASSSTADASSSADAGPIVPAEGASTSSTGSSGVSPTPPPTDTDRDYFPAADQDFVRAFVAACTALIACVLLVCGVRWWRSRGERARGLHMQLSQRSSPRLGGAIMLDGSFDPEYDEADDAESAPHWPSESGAARGSADAGGRRQLSEHDQQMIELEEAIGAGLSGYSDDDLDQLQLDEREFRNAIGHVGDSSGDRINTAPASDMP